MQITDIKIKKTRNQSRIVGFATVTFDDCFVIHDVRIIKKANTSDMFLSMPSKKLKNGNYLDTCHPIKSEFREEMTKEILEKLEQE